MRPGTETDYAQNQRREYSDIQHRINHAFPPLKADCQPIAAVSHAAAIAFAPLICRGMLSSD
jgi:hypothetical protein